MRQFLLYSALFLSASLADFIEPTCYPAGATGDYEEDFYKPVLEGRPIQKILSICESNLTTTKISAGGSLEFCFPQPGSPYWSRLPDYEPDESAKEKAQSWTLELKCPGENDCEPVDMGRCGDGFRSIMAPYRVGSEVEACARGGELTDGDHVFRLVFAKVNAAAMRKQNH